MTSPTDNRWPLRLLWPAFLTACALELVVFAVVDPAALAWVHGRLHHSDRAVLAAGFFTFWAISFFGQLGACAMARPGHPSQSQRAD